MSKRIAPCPSHNEHRPISVLKLKVPGKNPRRLLSGSSANKSRISSKSLVYVAGLLRGVRPIGL